MSFPHLYMTFTLHKHGIQNRGRRVTALPVYLKAHKVGMIMMTPTQTMSRAHCNVSVDIHSSSLTHAYLPQHLHDIANTRRSTFLQHSHTTSFQLFWLLLLTGLKRGWPFILSVIENYIKGSIFKPFAFLFPFLYFSLLEVFFSLSLRILW